MASFFGAAYFLESKGCKTGFQLTQRLKIHSGYSMKKAAHCAVFLFAE